MRRPLRGAAPESACIFRELRFPETARDFLTAKSAIKWAINHLVSQHTNSPARAAGEFVLSTSLPSAQRETSVSALSESLLLQVAFFFGGGLGTRSRRSANAHGLLPPILSLHVQHLTHLLWYCYRDAFMLSGCAHRCCDRDSRYRGQSDHQFAYHGAHSSIKATHPSH
jgi:hypothetical protein